MQIPKDVPLVVSDMEGDIERPTGVPWWMEAYVPQAHRPATITLVHQGEARIMWRCGASPRGFSEDEHITTGATDLLTFARVATAQLPALRRVGDRTHHALDLGIECHYDDKTGKLPDDITKALAERDKAAAAAWEALAPVVKRTGASITEEDVRTWALHVMGMGFTSFNKVL